MAGGGIVSFQYGGGVTDAEGIAIEMLALQTQLQRPNKTEGELRELQTRIGELDQRMADETTGNLRANVHKAMDRMSGFEPDTGMYGGGRVKGYSGEYGSNVERNKQLDEIIAVTEGPEAVTEGLMGYVSDYDPDLSMIENFSPLTGGGMASRKLAPLQLTQRLEEDPLYKQRLAIYSAKEAAGQYRGGMASRKLDEQLRQAIAEYNQAAGPSSEVEKMPDAKLEEILKMMEDPGPIITDENVEKNVALMLGEDPGSIIPDENETPTQNIIVDASGNPVVDSAETPAMSAMDILTNVSEEERKLREGLTSFGLDNLSLDREAEAGKIASEFDQRVGLSGRREALEAQMQANQSTREDRFSPEEEQRRTQSAFLRGIARRGLGGGAEGVGEERDRISIERMASGKATAGDMEKLITQYEGLGLKRMEAVAAAEQAVDARRATGATTLSAQQEQLQKDREARANNADKAAQRRNALDMVTIQMSKLSDVGQAREDYINWAVANSGADKQEAARKFQLIQEEIKRETARLTAQVRTQSDYRNLVVDIYEMVAAALPNMTASTGEKTAIVAEIMAQLNLGGTTPGVGTGDGDGNALDKFFPQ